MKLDDFWSGGPSLFLRKQNKMSKNTHESKVKMVISTVPNPNLFSVCISDILHVLVINRGDYLKLSLSVESGHT